jgi:hypothetical protein
MGKLDNLRHDQGAQRPGLKSLASQAGVAWPSRIIWTHCPDEMRARNFASISSIVQEGNAFRQPDPMPRPWRMRHRAQPMKARQPDRLIDFRKPVEALGAIRRKALE